MTGAHPWFIVKALGSSAIAAAFVAGIFLESGLDRLIIGFLSGSAFSFVLAFFNREGKGRFY